MSNGATANVLLMKKYRESFDQKFKEWGGAEMTDITKCSGEGCPLKETCYRFTAKASDWQSWFAEVPYKDGKCEMEWRRK